MEITIQIELLITIVAVIVSMFGAVVGLAVKGTKAVGRIQALEDRMDAVHEGCHLPIDAIPEMQEDIKTLQSKDEDRAVRLTAIETTLNQVNAMTTKIYDHFFTKGINSGRRKEDDLRG